MKKAAVDDDDFDFDEEVPAPKKVEKKVKKTKVRHLTSAFRCG